MREATEQAKGILRHGRFHGNAHVSAHSGAHENVHESAHKGSLAQPYEGFSWSVFTFLFSGQCCLQGISVLCALLRALEVQVSMNIPARFTVKWVNFD